MPDCTQTAFLNDPNQDLNWYKANYPFLASMSLPLSMDDLSNFYYADMTSRNLTPESQYLYCYEYLWSYFLANFPELNNPTRFKGKTYLEYSLQNLPGAIKKSFTDIGNGINNFATNILGMPLWLFALIALALLIFFVIILKKV